MFYTQQAFNGGAITPWMDGRSDFKKYRSSVRKLENFIATPYGPIRRRCGTEFIAFSPKRARLIPFQRSINDGYLVELCGCSMRVLKDGVELNVFASPWESDEINDVHVLKLNNIMLMTQSNHPPQELRYTSGVWTFGPTVFDHPPFLGAPFDGTTMTVTPDGTSESTSSIFFELTEFDIIETASGTVPIYGSWEVVVDNYVEDNGHTGDKTLKLQRSTDGGATWTDVQTFSADGTYTGTLASGILRLSAQSVTFSAILTSTNAVPALSAGDAVTVVQSAGTVFTPDMVGSEIKVNHYPDETELKQTLSTSGTSDWITIQGEYTLTTSGNWYGRLYLEKSTDNGVTVERVIDRSASGDRNITYQGSTTEKSIFRLRFFRFAGTPENSPHAYLESDGSPIGGRIEITGYTSSSEVTGTVIEGVYSSDPTDDWQLAAWSNEYGWPAAITWHEGRVIYGGTEYSPDTFWLSRIDDYYNFRAGTNDDDAFSVTIGSDVLSEIVFLASQDGIVVGTSGDAWIGKSYSDNGVITPSSLVMRRVSDVGSSRLQPLFASSGILHLQRERRALIQLGYNPSSASQSGYSPTDLNILNPNITEGSITTLAKQQARESIVWATTGDGDLLGLSYDPSQDIYGWHKHPMEATVQSVAVLYESGNEDSVYISTERDGRFHIERFTIDQYEQLENGAKQDGVFLDCSTVYDGEPTAWIYGLNHLDGRAVEVIADGVRLNDQAIISNELYLQTPASKVIIGLPYTSLIESLPVHVDMQDGSTAGRMKKTLEAYVNVYRSVTAEVACTGSGSYKWQQLKQSWRKSNDVGNEEAADSLGNLETWKIPVISGHDRDARIAVRCSDPVPLNILSINQKVQLTSE